MMAPTMATDSRLERSSLIREHDGNVVAYGILQAAVVADEAWLLGAVL